ncbi:arginine/ornithine antiporter [Clostridium sp. CAG:762]|nr:arginine/ornithine antiporter [Clostridium sp. CAG:762]
MAKTKKKKFVLTSFSIIFIIIVLLGIVSHLLPKAVFNGEEIVNGSGVVGAKISDILSAPILGFQDAADVSVFILVLGGLLAIVTKTGALETGIKVLVKKLKGRELILIPILMLIFSIGGTTYGMMEETVAFYGLLSFTMVAAGMDTIVASATVLLGAGVGVLGSTINPFAVGAAISALPEGIQVNQGITIGLGVALWIVSYIIAVLFVLSYAKKVKADKGSTFLSLQEQKAMQQAYAKDDYLNDDAKLTTRQKIVLWLFGLTFIVMIIGFIPWVDFGIIPADVADAGTHFSAILTGNCFGYWYFLDGAVWFFVMAIIIGIVGKLKEHELVDAFISGASDILSVVLIIAVARGASVLMKTTHLDNYIIYNAAEALKGTPAGIFAPLNYLLHVGLSFLVPSSSGLASLSTPIMGPLAYQLGFSVETNIMILVAANGLVNLITPTCGAIMGGLALARVDYATWFKWSIKIVITIALASMVILTLAMIAL